MSVKSWSHCIKSNQLQVICIPLGVVVGYGQEIKNCAMLQNQT